MSKTLTPIGDRVVIKADAEEKVSSGGIYLPDAAKKKPERGKVLAVGPGKLSSAASGDSRLEMEVKEGDRVLFDRYAAQEVELGEEKYLIVSQESILAVLS